jgi:hypothetical protein
MPRLILQSLLLLLTGLRVLAQPAPPTRVEVTIDPQKFGDAASILKVDSTIATFRFDQPVKYLALVLEAYPKEAQSIPLARLALDLTKPVSEGRLCVQMADQGFLPIGNGAPNQMQLFMQLDCGGTLISSSQSFLKEKFNCNKSLARTGAGTNTRVLAGNRAPVFWLMGNSDNGTYLNDDDLEKMIAKNNRDAYVLIAYLEVSKDAPAPALAERTAASAKGDKPAEVAAPAVTSPTSAVAAATPPVNATAPETPKEQVKRAESTASTDSEKESASKSAKASSPSSTRKKRRRT